MKQEQKSKKTRQEYNDVKDRENVRAQWKGRGREGIQKIEAIHKRAVANRIYKKGRRVLKNKSLKGKKKDRSNKSRTRNPYEKGGAQKERAKRKKAKEAKQRRKKEKIRERRKLGLTYERKEPVKAYGKKKNNIVRLEKKKKKKDRLKRVVRGYLSYVKVKKPRGVVKAKRQRRAK